MEVGEAYQEDFTTVAERDYHPKSSRSYPWGGTLGAVSPYLSTPPLIANG